MSSIQSRITEFRREFDYFYDETWLGYAFLLPAAIVTIAIILYPIVNAVWLSFFENSLVSPQQATWIGLSNYAQILSDATFSIALWHSILLTVVAVSLEYLLGLALALILREKVPGIDFFRSITMVTWVVPAIVTVITFNWLVQPDYGLINIIFESLGLPTTYWFGDPTWAFPLIMAMHIWRNAPFFAIALFASMQTIPRDLYESAKMDGAGPLNRFRYITLPYLSNTSMIMIVIHVIYTFNNFDLVYLSTGGGPLNTTEVLPTYIYKQAFSRYALGYAASIGMVMLVVMMLFTVVYIKLEETE